jgi:integrase
MGRKPTRYEGVRAASKSTIEIDFYFEGRRERTRIKLKPTPLNLKRAANHRASILQSIEIGTFDPRVTLPKSSLAKRMPLLKSELTVGDYLESWLDQEEPHIKASTFKGYLKILNHHLIPAFGKIPILELSPKHVREYLQAQTSSAKTQRNIVSPLRIALNQAVEDEILERNPIQDFRVRARKAPVSAIETIDPFDHKERELILGALNGQAQNLIKFAFWTGMRTSELIALNWSDIDQVEGTVRVNKALTQASVEPEEPKTRAGNRDVKLLSGALEAIEAQRQHTYFRGEELFQNPRTLERWVGDAPIRKTLWVPALRRAGVRYRNPYQTRHTFASMCLTAGENVMWVSAQMGLKDWGFTARTYAKFIDSDQASAGSKLEALQKDQSLKLSH